jgi:RNA recognition motif-containing protein
MSDTARLKSTIFVGGLDNAVTAGTLHAAFVPFGEIVDISLPKPELPSSPDPHRGFGYVEFELAEDAREAMDNMDQSELFGRVIKVAAAKPQKDNSEGLGSRTAVWNQVGQVSFDADIFTNTYQEGYLASHAVNEEDRIPVAESDAPMDPMQGLEGLDVAGPKAG